MSSPAVVPGMRLIEAADGSGWASFGPLGLEDPYRYGLCRKVGPGDRRVGFMMLNPSSATHEVPDPTITRCIIFARGWGFGWLEVGNLFGYRSKNPADLLMGDHLATSEAEVLALLASSSMRSSSRLRRP